MWVAVPDRRAQSRRDASVGEPSWSTPVPWQGAQRRKLTLADFDRLNVNGSGISLGHPVGATGARILATLARAPPPSP